jgi:hypothetical protein
MSDTLQPSGVHRGDRGNDFKHPEQYGLISHDAFESGEHDLTSLTHRDAMEQSDISALAFDEDVHTITSHYARQRLADRLVPGIGHSNITRTRYEQPHQYNVLAVELPLRGRRFSVLSVLSIVDGPDQGKTLLERHQATMPSFGARRDASETAPRLWTPESFVVFHGVANNIRRANEAIRGLRNHAS